MTKRICKHVRNEAISTFTIIQCFCPEERKTRHKPGRECKTRLLWIAEPEKWMIITVNQNRTTSWMALFKNLELKESYGMRNLISKINVCRTKQ